jgi:predicted dehydrogenase
MPGMNAHALSVGIIGLGYGRAHIPAFQANGCRVVARAGSARASLTRRPRLPGGRIGLRPDTA